MNAQSLLYHFDSIEHILINGNIDILCICETWLESNFNDEFLKISNFNIFRCDAGRGAGVCLYVREDFKISVLDTGLDRCGGVEDMWLQVQHRHFPSFITGCIYRHPKALITSFTYGR